MSDTDGTVERQIKEAFIDGYLSAKGSDNYLPDAEAAWTDENVTERSVS